MYASHVQTVRGATCTTLHALFKGCTPFDHSSGTFGEPYHDGRARDGLKV